MFTPAGNTAVAEICNKTVSNHNDRDSAYSDAVEELCKLGKVHAFAEASDTEVREQVWLFIERNIPGIPVFRTVRKKAIN